MRDFFISYNKADRRWAEWMAWQLEEQKWTVFLQHWDIGPGNHFVLEMDKAAKEAERIYSAGKKNREVKHRPHLPGRFHRLTKIFSDSNILEEHRGIRSMILYSKTSKKKEVSNGHGEYIARGREIVIQDDASRESTNTPMGRA